MANDGLSTKQRAAIRALLSGASYTDAAKAAGVHENTVSMWMKDTNFYKALRAAENAATIAISRQLITIADKAAETLKSVLESPTARDSSKVRAADVVLGRLIELQNISEIMERLNRLEELKK